MAGVSQGDIYGEVHDEWGISPHHFPNTPPPSEEVAKLEGGALRQMRSMPFPSREAWAATSDPPPPVPSIRPLPAPRHSRKNSKVAQILGIAGAPEKARDADPLSNLEGFMSPPILPMEVDPFSGGPLGATIVSNVDSAIQMQATHLPATQHAFRPTLSMPHLLNPLLSANTTVHLQRM